MNSDAIIAIKSNDGDVNVHCTFDRFVNINDVMPYPRNANRHSDDQINLLARLICGDGEKKGCGWRVPITVSNQSGFVVRGHGRLIVAKKLGMEQVPVDYQDYESPFWRGNRSRILRCHTPPMGGFHKTRSYQRSGR